jgi:hypothetical protein
LNGNTLAAQETSESRVYGGIHFEFSNQDGLTAGQPQILWQSCPKYSSGLHPTF